jgi:hypothetical protein
VDVRNGWLLGNVEYRTRLTSGCLARAFAKLRAPRLSTSVSGALQAQRRCAPIDLV